MSRLRKIGNESKKLQIANRDMEKRLNEIKALFEKEQVKREKEALIWASSASGDRGATKKRTQQIDKQSRNILGKTYKGQIKVLKGDEPLKLPNRQRDPELQKFIDKEQQNLKAVKSKTGISNLVPRPPVKGTSARRSPLPKSPNQQNVPIEDNPEFVLFSDIHDSEIFEVPTDEHGQLSLQTVKAIGGSRTIGIFCKVQGRKRIILGENGVLARPSGGWTNKTFYPLHPPRSSRPSTARSSRDSRPMTPSTNELRSEPMDQKTGSLLHGTYDEVAAAADFQAAIQQFRNGGQENHIHSGTGSSAVDQENQISDADKLKEVTNLFSKKTDLSQIKIEKERLKKFLESNQVEVQSNEATLSYQMTEEELDIEEERENLRKMFISSSAHHADHESSCQDKIDQNVALKTSNEDSWTVPTDWSNAKPETVLSARHLSTDEVQKDSVISEMWMPTTQLQFAEIKDNSNDESLFNENLHNDDETELEAEFDEEIETEINQSYRVNDSYDMTNGDPFNEYQLQLDKMVNVTTSQNMTANVPRPLSRASLVTDAEIDANQTISRELSNIESQFYPDDDQY